MRRAAEAVVVLCVLAFVVTLYGCGGSGGPNGPSEGSAGKTAGGGGGEYYVTELPPTGGATSVAVQALSNPGTDGGDSVLWAGGDLETGARGIVWKVVLPSKPSDAPAVTAFEIGASQWLCDINEYGRAVGATHGNDPFCWDNGSLITLDDNGSEEGGATAIGRDPNVVRIGGRADMVEKEGTLEGCAALWEFEANDPPASPTRRIGAYEGAFSVQVAGIQDTGTDGLKIAVYHWGDGGPTAVAWEGPLEGDLAPTQAGVFMPSDMNAGGAVVGSWGKAYLLQDGVLSVLPFLSRPFDQAQASSINDQGVVVGQNSIFLGRRMTGVRWQGGKAADLNKLVAPGAVVGSIIDGRDINNLGQIAANSVDDNGNLHAYLLRPK